MKKPRGLVVPMPVSVQSMLRRWLQRRGYQEAARALARGDLRRVLLLTRKCDREEVRQLVEAMLAQRQRRRALRAEQRAEERRLWETDPILREARAYYMLGRRRRAWVRDARELLRQIYTDAARDLLRERGVRPTVENFRAAVAEVRAAVKAQCTLRLLPGGRDRS